MVLMEQLEEMCNRVFSEYLKFLTCLSQTINEGANTKPIVDNFKANISKAIEELWQPFFNQIDNLKQQLDQSANTNGNQTSENVAEIAPNPVRNLCEF